VDLACFIFAQVEVLVLSGARYVAFGLHLEIDVVVGESVVHVPRGTKSKADLMD